MNNPCRIDARNSHAQIMENDANMAPKWRSKSIKKHEKTIQKHITKNDAKMKRPKAIGPKWALGPACWKRQGVPPETPGQGSLLHPTSCKKQTPSKQLKSKALEPLAVNSHALDVPAGTVRIY